MYQFVIKEKYIDLLLGLEKCPEKLRECSKRINMNYEHLSTVIKQFEKENIIVKDKTKTAYDVVLTEKGKRIVSALRDLKKAIEE